MIRQAEEKDIKKLEDLYRKRVKYNDAHGIHQWEEADVTWEQLSKTYQISDFYVIEEKNRVIASACFVDDDPLYWPMMKKGESFYLHKLCVDPDEAKRGFSTQLITFFKQRGKELGYPDVRLDVRSHKAKLRRMYEAQGFQLVCVTSIFEGYDTALYRYTWK